MKITAYVHLAEQEVRFYGGSLNVSVTSNVEGEPVVLSRFSNGLATLRDKSDSILAERCHQRVKQADSRNVTATLLVNMGYIEVEDSEPGNALVFELHPFPGFFRAILFWNF